MDQPGDDDYGIPVHVFAKNKQEQIRISLNEYKGHQYIDIRTFYLKDGKYLPGPKGVTLKKELYAELAKGVAELAPLLGIDPDAIDETPPEVGN